MSFLSRISFLILLCAVVGSAEVAAQNVSFKTQCQRLLSSIKRGTKAQAAAGWQTVKKSVADIGHVVEEEYCTLRGKNPRTGQDRPTNGQQEGFFAGCKRRGKESVIPAALATGGTVAASYLFETIFQTSSRRRRKAVVLPLLLLSSWYGTHMRAVRPEFAPGEGQSMVDGVSKRLTALGVTSGLITFIVSLVKQWTSGNLDNDETLTEEQRERLRKKRFGFRQHVAWSIEVGSMYALAAYLGYTLQGVAGPQVAQPGEMAGAVGGGEPAAGDGH